KMLGADQFPHGEIGFQRGAGRTDSDRMAAQPTLKMGQRGFPGNRLPVKHRFAVTPLAVDESVAETPSIAEKIAVHFAVVAIDDAPERSVAFAGAGIASHAAVHANR